MGRSHSGLALPVSEHCGTALEGLQKIRIGHWSSYSATVDCRCFDAARTVALPGRTEP